MKNINIKKCTCCGCNILWDNDQSHNSMNFTPDNSVLRSIIVKPVIKYENEKTTVFSVVCDKCGFKNALITIKSDVPLFR